MSVENSLPFWKASGETQSGHKAWRSPSCDLHGGTYLAAGLPANHPAFFCLCSVCFQQNRDRSA